MIHKTLSSPAIFYSSFLLVDSVPLSLRFLGTRDELPTEAYVYLAYSDDQQETRPLNFTPNNTMSFIREFSEPSTLQGAFIISNKASSVTLPFTVSHHTFYPDPSYCNLNGIFSTCLFV